MTIGSCNRVLLPICVTIVLAVGIFQGIGLCTPPVGSTLFVGCAVGNVKMEQVAKTIWPFYIAMLVVLFLVTYFSAISMTLPTWAQ